MSVPGFYVSDEGVQLIFANMVGVTTSQILHIRNNDNMKDMKLLLSPPHHARSYHIETQDALSNKRLFHMSLIWISGSRCHLRQSRLFQRTSGWSYPKVVLKARPVSRSKVLRHIHGRDGPKKGAEDFFKTLQIFPEWCTWFTKRGVKWEDGQIFIPQGISKHAWHLKQLARLSWIRGL